MRKALVMSVRLSASCRSHARPAQALQSVPAWAAGPRLLPSPGSMCSDSTVISYGRFVASSAGGVLGPLAHKAQRATQTRAYSPQYNNAAVTEEEYTVQSMPWDPMAANAVSLIGNTGRDVEIKRLETGRVVGMVTLACTHKAGQTTW